MNFSTFRWLFGTTLRNPSEAVAWLRAQHYPMGARWMALILAVSLSALLNWVVARMVVSTEPTAMGLLSSQPLLLAAMQVCAVVITAALMERVGRMFGGTGNFVDALLLMTWIEVILLVVQMVQVVLLFVLPLVSAILGLVAMLLFIGLTILFTRELHGFQSTWKVALGVLATALATGFVLSFIAAAMGLLPGVPA